MGTEGTETVVVDAGVSISKLVNGTPFMKGLTMFEFDSNLSSTNVSPSLLSARVLSDQSSIEFS